MIHFLVSLRPAVFLSLILHLQLRWMIQGREKLPVNGSLVNSYSFSGTLLHIFFVTSTEIWCLKNYDILKNASIFVAAVNGNVDLLWLITSYLDVEISLEFLFHLPLSQMKCFLKLKVHLGFILILLGYILKWFLRKIYILYKIYMY